MIKHYVARGTIRRMMSDLRRYRDSPADHAAGPGDAREAAKEVVARIPVFDVEAGRQELLGYYRSARTRGR